MIYVRFYWPEEKKRMLESYFIDGKNILKYIVGFLYPQDSHLYIEQSIDQKYWEKISPILNRYMFYPPCHCVPKQQCDKCFKSVIL